MSTAAAISLSVTIVLALLGYVATYVVTLRVARHNERIALITRRLRDFYGPLHVASKAGETAYSRLVIKLGREDLLANGRIPSGRELFEPQGQMTEADLKEWRVWCTYVFRPLNDIREQIVLTNAYLAREDVMPDCLLEFVAHASEWKAILMKWEVGDYHDHVALIEFPQMLAAYAESGYNELSAEQATLQTDGPWAQAVRRNEGTRA